jgi:hypothetical protein
MAEPISRPLNNQLLSREAAASIAVCEADGMWKLQGDVGQDGRGRRSSGSRRSGCDERPRAGRFRKGGVMKGICTRLSNLLHPSETSKPTTPASVSRKPRSPVIYHFSLRH